MTDKQRELIIASLLYDIWPIKTSDHEMVIQIADDMTNAADKRTQTAHEAIDKRPPLDSIFNRLNEEKTGRQNKIYQPAILTQTSEINYPAYSNESVNSDKYQDIQKRLKKALQNWEKGNQEINALLRILEENLSYISSSSKKEPTDISLYDHAKMRAALAVCIDASLNGEMIQDKKALYDKPLFLLFSMDMSGIQDFIYQQYENKDVLKNLRARSFYLDIMMENAIDDLLLSLNLSRVNLIYSGGGHAYLLLPNTPDIREKTDQYEADMNTWIRETFQADLYLAAGYTPCNANDLSNNPAGSYSQMFKRVSNVLSDKKIHRYNAAEIIALNHVTSDTHGRECRVCHRSDHLTSDNLCELCSGLIALSNHILDDDRFMVVSEKQQGAALPLGNHRFLVTDNHQNITGNVIRTYIKNIPAKDNALSTHLWVGDYCTAPTLEALVKQGKGISRLGVLRADVDNLGQAFVAGFPADYQTLSRSATFSRKMSLFFKLYINDLLKHGTFSLDSSDTKRQAAIIYSGGDDIFLVGAWKDVLEFAVDLYHALNKFSQGSLTFSCGFGIYKPSYPISYMAEQTGALEDDAKENPGKNSITLFEEGNRFSWPVFIKQVLNEKFSVIYHFFEMECENTNSQSTARGKSFIYHILDLFRNREEKINLARLAYTLSRLEPDKKASDERKEAYSHFSNAMYQWLKSEKDSKEAITAIYLYVYLIRNDEEVS